MRHNNLVRFVCLIFLISVSRCEPADEGGEPEPEGSGTEGRSSDPGLAQPEPENNLSQNNWRRRSILLELWQQNGFGPKTDSPSTRLQSTIWSKPNPIALTLLLVYNRKASRKLTSFFNLFISNPSSCKQSKLFQDNFKVALFNTSKWYQLTYYS